jgi:hypothetical protein
MDLPVAFPIDRDEILVRIFSGLIGSNFEQAVGGGTM